MWNGSARSTKIDLQEAHRVGLFVFPRSAVGLFRLGGSSNGLKAGPLDVTGVPDFGHRFQPIGERRVTDETFLIWRPDLRD